MTTDARARPAGATQGGLTLTDLLLLLGLLGVPAVALYRAYSDANPLIPLGYALLISIVAFVLYAVDKKRAQTGRWRLSEAKLHLAALAGGWPGGFLAQRKLRHKNAKLSFQLVFWLIVMLHQFLAVDSLLDWRISRALRAMTHRSS